MTGSYLIKEFLLPQCCCSVVKLGVRFVLHVNTEGSKILVCRLRVIDLINGNLTYIEEEVNAVPYA